MTAEPGARWAIAVAAVAWVFVTAQLVFFALFQPVWSPIDEFNHFFYVDYLNYDHRPPALNLPYQGTLDPSVPPDLSIPPSYGRGVSMARQQIATEGIQPPAYYVLMVPAFRTSRHGTYEQVMAVRFATAALAAGLIPVTFVLARLAMPQTPWVWGAGSLLPALSRGYPFNLSQVTNDGLALVVGSISLLVSLWLVRARLSWRWGLIAGLTAGLALVTKVTVYFVPVLLAIVFLYRLRRDRLGRGALSAVGVGLVSSLALSLPWFLLNLHRYHAITPPIGQTANLASLTNLPLLQALREMVLHGSLSFWVGEGFTAAATPRWLVALGEIGLIACALGFVVVPFWKERPLSTASLVFSWLIGGMTVLFLVMLATHVAVLTGRYVYPLFAPIAVVCAAGATRFGAPGRWLFIGSGLFLAIGMVIGLQSEIRWSLGI